MPLSASHLTRRFGRFTAIDDATFEVPAGRIAGFLGPNGAGKTTTLKILSGLLRPHGGKASVAGRDPQSEREAVLSLSGCLIETPGFFDHLTARENVTMLGSLGRKPPAPARVNELFEQLGIAQHSERRVAGFSTGMRMRLALALALLHRPKVLLLDEPTAGLDPQGRRAVRDLLIGANRSDGATVFISSHLLEELETFCDWLVVIQGGRVAASGPMDQLLPTRGESRFALRVEPAEPAIALLKKTPGVSEVERSGSEVLCRALREQVPDLVRALVAKDVRLHELRDLGRSLEAFYLDVTRKTS